MKGEYCPTCPIRSAQINRFISIRKIRNLWVSGWRRLMERRRCIVTVRRPLQPLRMCQLQPRNGGRILRMQRARKRPEIRLRFANQLMTLLN
jgi:hypothetical protein